MHRLRRALASEGATVATFLVLWLLCTRLHAGPAPAILGAVIAIALSRRREQGEHLHLAIEAPGVVIIGLLATVVGLLMRWNLTVGGTVFALAVGASILLRGLHGDVRRLSAVVALPFIAILVVPIPANALERDRWLFLCAPLIALVFAECVNRIGGGRAQSESPRPERLTSTVRPPAHVRMALQMFVALELAFILGATFYPEHWPWMVLSAYIVCAGALGRADAVHKGVLRLAGALGGGLLAAVLTATVPSNGIVNTIVIFAALFAGFVVRDINYAYWAACTTTIFAMLQRIDAVFSLSLYLTRLECIVAGAACGIVAASFVLPLKTSDILRRRLASALKALEERDAHTPEELHRALDAVNRLAHPLELHRRVIRPSATFDHPSQWVRITRDIFSSAEGARGSREALNRAIRRARAAIRDKRGVTDALLAVRDLSSDSGE